VNRLKEVRLQRGISQAELGRRMCIDPSIVRHVEAGRMYPYPRFQRLAAEILGLMEEELFGREEDGTGQDDTHRE